MMRSLFALAVAASIVNVANAECANACNGHGKCTSYDMCICNRNWQANDCSERVCQFGLAHVDTPKGDLDMNGVITGPDNLISENSFNYPYGTTEQFPAMQDSDLQNLVDSAHYYMECSNKGTCDRTSGECTCFDGYDGAACQRASCPGYPASCSGHGVCKTIQQLAAADYDNVYELWDKKTTMGCECDAGYYGSDCSQRKCKYGVDPLYLDDSATIKYSTFDFAVLTTAGTAGQAAADLYFSDGMVTKKRGFWAIRFYDAHGEDWLTQPIVAGATCNSVVAALEAIPNDVIPRGQTWCTLAADQAQDPLGTTDAVDNNWLETYDAQSLNDPYPTHKYLIEYKMTFWEAQLKATTNTATTDLRVSVGSLPGATNLWSSYSAPGAAALSGFVYRIKFYGNPGKLREPQIETYLDGKRPSIATTPGNVVITKVWTDGQQGENVDYFADHCDGVTVSIGKVDGPPSYQILQGITAAENLLLRKCLGASDFDSSNNKDLENWDRGTEIFPHIVKLVRSVTTYTDGGYYVVLYYDGTNFKLINPFKPPDGYTTDLYEVYTTKGTLALTSNYTEAVFDFASKDIILTDVAGFNSAAGTRDLNDLTRFSGGISCETEYNMKYRSLHSDTATNGEKTNTETKYIQHCLNKTDLFVLLNWDNPQDNPPHININTATKLYTKHFDWSMKTVYDVADVLDANEDSEASLGTHILTSDLSTNWAAAKDGMNKLGTPVHPVFKVYKFFPAPESSYEYVAECSNRGICSTDTGLCTCFPGYSSDSCHEQNSLAV